MNAIIVGGDLDALEANVIRYRHFWDECQGPAALTQQGREPKVGLTTHIVLAATEEEAVARAEPAWADYRWNLGTPRRLEAERRKLTQFLNQPGTGDFEGPRPERHMALEERRDLEASLEQLAEDARTARAQRRKVPSPIPGIMCGTPETIAPFMDEYMTTGANYMLCSFQFGSLSHDHAMESIRLWRDEIMPRYGIKAAVG